MNRGEVAPAGLYEELAAHAEVYTWDDLAREGEAGAAGTGQEVEQDWSILSQETVASFDQPERISGGLGTTHEDIALGGLSFRLHEISYGNKDALSIALTARPDSVDGRPAHEFGLAV